MPHMKENRLQALERLDAARDPRALLHLKTVTTLVGLCNATVYVKIKQGNFPPPVKIGKASRWKASDVHGWLREHGGIDEVTMGSSQHAPLDIQGHLQLSAELRQLADQVKALSKQVEGQTGRIDALHSRLSRVGEAFAAGR